MQVKLRSGHTIVLGAAVVKTTSEGTMISHREFHATVNGQPATITIEELEGAQFPPGVTMTAAATFNASLPDVRANWEALARQVGLE